MTVEATPARRVRDAIEPVAMVHVHSDEARERYAALGLERFGGYVLGRAGVLGVPPTPVVIATFGAFSPALLAGVYETALATASVPDVVAATEAAASAALHRVLGEPGREVAEVTAALRAGAEAVEVLGKPLFAGHLALDWPADAWGRLWHATILWREMRGPLDPAIEAVGSALDEVVARCDAWSAEIIAAGAFPDDEHKRAAG